MSLRAGRRANGLAMRMILPAWFGHLERRFSYKKVHLRKTVALLLKTLMQFLPQANSPWCSTPESDKILCPSSRWPQGLISTAAVTAVLLMRFRACCRVVRASQGTSYCTARLTFKTCNMPNNTFSLRPLVEWKGPRPRMDGPSYKFQVCVGTSYSVQCEFSLTFWSNVVASTA